jgi:hypothetical protein
LRRTNIPDGRIPRIMAGPSAAIKTFRNTILALEKQRKSRIYSIVHVGGNQHICRPEFSTALAVREKFRGIKTLEILIHSTGGHSSVAFRLAQYFRRHCKQLNILVPIMAKSAATLLSLNADLIFMGEFAELGPLDTQLRDDLDKGGGYFSPLDEFRSVEFLREHAAEMLDYLSFTLEERGMSVKQALHEAIPGVVGMMRPLYGQVDPSKLGSYRRALAEGEEYAKRLLSTQMDEDDADDLAEKLVWDYPAHDFVIDYEEAQTIGLPVERFPVTQEKSLINAILGLINYGLPYIGFTHPQPQPRRPRVAKRKPTPRKLPSSAQAGPRPVAS